MKSKIKLSLIISILMLLIGIFAWQFPKNLSTQDNDEYDNKNATFEGDVYQGNFTNADFSKVVVKDIPYSHQWTLKTWAEPWQSISNVLIKLPLGKEAFISKLEQGKEYNIAYTNSDCSDITISEAYVLPQEFTDKEVCYTHKLACGSEVMELEKLYGKISTEEYWWVNYEYASYRPTKYGSEHESVCIEE